MTATQPLMPRDAFDMLLAGNERFVAGAPEHPNQDAARRAEVVPSQRPYAALFECSDSRLATEIIFDRGLGDSCGAVAAACAALEEGMPPAAYARDVVERVTPSVLAARAAGRVQTDAGTLAVVGMSYSFPPPSPQVIADKHRLGKLARKTYKRIVDSVGEKGHSGRHAAHRPPLLSPRLSAVTSVFGHAWEPPVE